MKLVVLIALLALAVNSADPQVQIHLAQGVSPGTIIFTWSTRLPTPTTYVRIAVGSSQWQLFQGTTRNFVDGSNAWVIHSATATLTPGMTYTYQVGCTTNGFSQSYTMVVPVASGATNFIIFGDLATDAYGANTWADIEANAKNLLSQFMIHVGDLAYDLSTDNSQVGDSYMATLQPIAGYIPYMVAAGNHETTDSYYNYLTRFDMPNTKYYYTYTVGPIRFLAVHTEAFLFETGMINSLMAFVYQTLNRSPADKAAYPWLIVYAHRPMYCIPPPNKPQTCASEAESIKQNLEPLFYQFKVDLYVNGHIHNYQRTSPVYQGKVMSSTTGNTYINPKATIYVTTGSVGADNTNVIIDLDNAPEWLITGDDRYSFSSLNVFNATHLHWQQLDTQTNNVIDEFWIVKA